MSLYLIIFAGIILTCVFLNKVSGKLGVPVLLCFLLLGLLCGSRFDQFAVEKGWAVERISSIALIFIMFYGGFGTRWKSAKPVVVEAGLLATVGVALTAGLVALFCHYALSWRWVESFLMGSVISSTDAASVFSILRKRKLGLKNNTAPLIEVESGSNDPMSYMLTAVAFSMIDGSVSASRIIQEIVFQLAFGTICGFLISIGAIFLLRRLGLKNNGFDILMFITISLLSYAIPDLIGGNGFLSAYIVGIIIGNTDFPGKKQLVPFFDVLTSLMQIIIFFLLGMLSVPSQLVHAIVPALIIFAFLTLIARPLAVGGVLVPFRKYPLNQLGLISFVGLRGAASIVFAIMLLTSGEVLENDIFSIVFCIVVISIALQGSLVPYVARKTKMIDENADVMTTFSDFLDESSMSFGSLSISPSSPWCSKFIRELVLPKDCLITLVVRGSQRIIPDGNTQLLDGDEVVICTRSYQDDATNSLVQHPLSANSKWAGHKVKEYPQVGKGLLVMISRGSERIIPNGDTVLQNGDILVILERKNT